MPIYRLYGKFTCLNGADIVFGFSFIFFAFGLHSGVLCWTCCASLQHRPETRQRTGVAQQWEHYANAQHHVADVQEDVDHMPCVPIREVPTGELACRVVRTRRRSWGDTLANGAAWRRASVPDEHDAVAQLFLHLAHTRLERLAEQTLEPADHLVLHLVVVTGGDL